MTLQTLDQLRRLREELPGVMEEVMQQFIADAPRQIGLIESAYNAADAEALRQNAHFLRSGALALGLNWLAEKSNTLEHMDLGEYGSEASGQVVAELRAELHRVLLALLKELKDSSR